MHRLLKLVARWMLLAAGLVLAVYVCEDLVLRYRVSHSGAGAVFDNVTTYEAGAVKGGKEEFYFDQPQVEICVRALFPHFGDAPCWYARRHTVKLLSLLSSGALGGSVAEDRYGDGARSSKLEVIWMPGWSERYTGHFGANREWTRPIVSRFSSGAAITNAT